MIQIGLEMATVMMKVTIKSATMMVEIVVEIMPIQITVPCVNVLMVDQLQGGLHIPQHHLYLHRLLQVL